MKQQRQAAREQQQQPERLNIKQQSRQRPEGGREGGGWCALLLFAPAHLPRSLLATSCVSFSMPCFPPAVRLNAKMCSTTHQVQHKAETLPAAARWQQALPGALVAWQAANQLQNNLRNLPDCPLSDQEFLGVRDWFWTHKLTRHAYCIGWRALRTAQPCSAARCISLSGRCCTQLSLLTTNARGCHHGLVCNLPRVDDPPMMWVTFCKPCLGLGGPAQCHSARLPILMPP